MILKMPPSFRRQLEFIAIMAWTLISLGVVLADVPSVPLRTVLAFPVIFIFTGYAFQALIFSGEGLTDTERVTYTIGLSFIFTILGGFVIYLSPWKLEPVSWMVYFTVMILLFSVMAMLKRFSSAMGEPLSYRVIQRGNRTQYAWFAVALIIVGVAFWGSRLAAENQPYDGFSQLWMVPEEEQDVILVEVGFRNYEEHITSYRIEVFTNKAVLLDKEGIELIPDEAWKVEFNVPKRVFPEYMTARLYLADDPTTIYREVILYPHWRWQLDGEPNPETGG